MQENQISHLFGTFPLLTEENMASCSRGFWKPENAEEEKKLIENATPNTCAQKMVKGILPGRCTS